MARQFIAALLMFSSLAALNGCQESPEDARQKLGDLGIEYSSASFLEAVENNDLKAVELFLTVGMDPNVKIRNGQDEPHCPASGSRKRVHRDRG